jgi:ATP-binding cassette subfamily F protein 3
VRLARDVGPPGREQELRDFLGSFRFVGDMVTQPVGEMSGGEKARLVLALLVWQRPNLLLLDEPTNHLDLTTREALSMALNEFEGTLMLVSHDRALLREVCDEFWLVTKGGVEDFDGDLDDYQRWLAEQAKLQAQAVKANAAAAKAASAAKPVASTPAPAPTAPATNAAAEPAAPARKEGKDDRKLSAQARQKLNDLTRPLRNELTRIDTRMPLAQAEHALVQERLCDASLSVADRTEQGKRLKALGDELETLEMRWLELTDEIERLTREA